MGKNCRDWKQKMVGLENSRSYCHWEHVTQQEKNENARYFTIRNVVKSLINRILGLLLALLYSLFNFSSNAADSLSDDSNLAAVFCTASNSCSSNNCSDVLIPFWEIKNLSVPLPVASTVGEASPPASSHNTTTPRDWLLVPVMCGHVARKHAVCTPGEDFEHHVKSGPGAFFLENSSEEKAL